MNSRDFRDFEIKDGKQAEFLMFGRFPWELIEQIGVVDSRMQGKVEELLSGDDCKPCVDIKQDWYY